MLRFVFAILGLLAIQNFPAATSAPGNDGALAEQAETAEEQPYAGVSAGWLDGAGGFIVGP